MASVGRSERYEIGFNATLTVFYRRVPPTVHEVYARRFRQVESNASGLETDKEYGDMYIVHLQARVSTAFNHKPSRVPTEVFNCCITSLRAHGTL